MLNRLIELLQDSIETLELALPLHLAHTKPEWRTSLQENLTALGAIVKAAITEAQASIGDATPAGQVKIVSKIVQDVGKKLGAFEARTVTAITGQAKALEREIFAHAAPVKPSGMAEVVWELRQREVRDQLRALDPIDRDLAYATSTDPLVIAACEEAPLMLVTGKLVPFVNPERRTTAIVERARQAAPEQATELDGLCGLAELYSTEIAGVRNALYTAQPEARPGRLSDGRGAPVAAGA